MKIIVTVEKGINVEVQPKEENQQVAITDIIASLEFAKTLVLQTWHEALQKAGEADVEDHETSGSN
jgi:hypothetical protein